MTATATLTCDACLEGRHRRCTRSCACSICPTAKPAPTVRTTMRKARERRAEPRRHVPTGRAPGRPRIHAGATQRERSTEHMRQVRAAEARRHAGYELLRDASGYSWSPTTRRIIEAEYQRLEHIIHG